MYCSGDKNNCQRLCGGIGKCTKSCENYNLKKQFKKWRLCGVKVIWIVMVKPDTITNLYLRSSSSTTFSK